MLQHLRILVDKKLSQQKTSQEKSKFEIIKEILKDDKCFFKIDADTAFSILYDLGFSKEEIKELYKELISSKNYTKKEA